MDLPVPASIETVYSRAVLNGEKHATYTTTFVSEEIFAGTWT